MASFAAVSTLTYRQSGSVNSVMILQAPNSGLCFELIHNNYEEEEKKNEKKRTNETNTFIAS